VESLIDGHARRLIDDYGDARLRGEESVAPLQAWDRESSHGNSGLSCAFIPVVPAGPPITRRTPPHEIAKVRAK
jgi:hypothetical protein